MCKKQTCIFCQQSFPVTETPDEVFGVCRYCEPKKKQHMQDIKAHRPTYLNMISAEAQRKFSALTNIEQGFILVRSLENQKALRA